MSFFNGVTPQSVASVPDGFKEFPIGDNEAFIKSVKEKTSESGNAMLEITFGNNGGAEIRYYIVDGEYKMQKLKALYVSFGIPMGETNINTWIGKQGIVVVKCGEPYNGKTYNKVSYLCPKKGTYQAPHNQQPTQAPYTPPPTEDGFTDYIPF